jgi:phosphoglycolate phosphatase
MVDSARSIVVAMTRAWAALGLGPPPAAEAIRHIVGLPLAEGAARLAPEAEPALHDAIAAAYRAEFLELRRSKAVEEPLYPGLVEALDALAAAGILLGVATGKALRGLTATLGAHGLLDRFVTLQTADGGAGKPHPRMVLEALAATGAEAGDTLMIGDTSYDILMAKNAGVGAIGVSWGYHDRDTLLAAGADRLVHDWSAIAAAVAETLDSEP